MVCVAECVSSAKQMLFHSAPLLTVILVDMAALLLYNYAGMCVTGESSHHSLPCNS